MSLRVLSKIPHGNARDVSVRTDGEIPEVSFSPDPREGPEALWFCFRLEETEPATVTPDKRVKLVLRYFNTLLGGSQPSHCMPVYKPSEQGWFRMKSGISETGPDGQVDASWIIDHPNPITEVALCFPYGRPEVLQLVDKSKGYWKLDPIGLSQGGRPLERLCNDYSTEGAEKPGVYLMARQHAGETPGSWVLDGFLQHMSRIKGTPCLVWAVPLADTDGVQFGNYGKDHFPYDLNRAWGVPPMRHETLCCQRDIERWKRRCKPALALDFHAPGACETDGLFCFLSKPDGQPDMTAENTKWANLIRESLGDEFASKDFRRTSNYPSRWETPTFTGYMNRQMQVPALTIETPYSSAGATLFTQKKYREAGERIAKAVLKRIQEKA